MFEAIALETEPSVRVAAQQSLEALQGVPGDRLTLVDRQVPECLDEVALAGADGPQTQRSSPRGGALTIARAIWHQSRTRSGPNMIAIPTAVIPKPIR